MADNSHNYDNQPPRRFPVQLDGDEIFGAYNTRLKMMITRTQIRLCRAKFRRGKVIYEIMQKEYEILMRDDKLMDEPPSIKDLQNSVDQLKLEEQRLLKRELDLQCAIDHAKYFIYTNRIEAFILGSR